MFNLRPKEKSGLDEVIDEVLAEYRTMMADSEEAPKLLDQLEQLYKIRNQHKDRVSKDTLAIVLGNLAGIAIIVGHERVHVITSKALSFILKSR